MANSLYRNEFINKLTAPQQLTSIERNAYLKYTDDRARQAKLYTSEPEPDRRYGVFRDKNLRPIESDVIRDIVDTTYSKERYTLVSVDSAQRDVDQFPHANQYSVYFNNEFTNVKKIELVSTMFSNSEQIINQTNNVFFFADIEAPDTPIRVVIPLGDYSVSHLAQVLENAMNSYARVTNGQAHAFDVIIDPETEITTIISRYNRRP